MIFVIYIRGWLIIVRIQRVDPVLKIQLPWEFFVYVLLSLITMILIKLR